MSCSGNVFYQLSLFRVFSRECIDFGRHVRTTFDFLHTILEKVVPMFVFHDDITGLLVQGSSHFWKVPRSTCNLIFECDLDNLPEQKESPVLSVKTDVLNNFTFS